MMSPKPSLRMGWRPLEVGTTNSGNTQQMHSQDWEEGPRQHPPNADTFKQKIKLG